MPESSKNVVGCFYLHTNGSIIFKPVIVFATEPEYFKSPFVKHVWLILEDPPHPTIIGQIKWVLGTFLKEAFEKGALPEEILRMVTALYSGDFEIYLKDFSPDDISSYIFDNKLDIFFNILDTKGVI